MAETDPPNIVAFNALVARVLTTLYEKFPIETELDGLRIALEFAQSPKKEDGDYIAQLSLIADDTIDFLIQEGFIRTQANASGQYRKTFPGCRLSLRGFSVLGSTPGSVDEAQDKRSLGVQIRDAVGKGAESSLGELVSKALSGVIQLGAGALGGWAS